MDREFAQITLQPHIWTQIRDWRALARLWIGDGSSSFAVYKLLRPDTILDQTRDSFQKMPFNLSIQHIHLLERRSYRFLKELGHGEYGSVAHAEKQTCSLPTQVALKLIENFESFQSELRVFNLLGSHPNIVAHRGSFSDQNTHVIELEYLSGQTLLDFLITNGSLSEHLARHYFAQLVSGMLHSHTVAVVAHRDIKAENLMICGQQLFILDWGMGLPFVPDQYHS